jgi:hypothetical protein
MYFYSNNHSQLQFSGIHLDNLLIDRGRSERESEVSKERGDTLRIDSARIATNTLKKTRTKRERE